MLKIKLGDYIEQINTRNENDIFEANSVVGLSTQKEVIHTKADLDGVKLTSYKLFSPSTFAYVPDTSRRGDKVSLAYNHDDITYLVSSISIVFKVSRPDILHPDYLFMWFNRPEFDRYARFNSWGSARETFSWEEMCDIDITLPPLHIQQKYVNIYNAMLANQRCYERGLDDLKLVCDAYIEELKKQYELEPIKKYIYESDRRNDINLSADAVRGLSTSKEMISTIADLEGINLHNYKVVLPRQIAYVSDTSRRGDKMSLGLNDTNKNLLVSSISIVFNTDKNFLLPEYLMLFLSRAEFDRYARFNSWGSARETFNFDDMCDVKIPLPDISIQKSIAEIFTIYKKRKEINAKLQAQIKAICPILIKGSLEEGSE